MTRALPVAILGTGACVPDKVLDNAFYASYLDTSDEWIVSRTGIKERRCVAEDESTLTIAHVAAKRAIEDAGLGVEDLDMIIVATASPETPLPSTACWLQEALGVPEGSSMAAFDICVACSGYVYGMVIASNMIATGTCKNVLLVGAEVLTRFTDFQDRATCVLFGDGAGAVVLTRSEDPNQCILHHKMGADGTKARAIWTPAGGTKLPASQKTVAERLHYMHMNGREIYKFAVQKMTELIRDTAAEAGVALADIKLIIPHQSNMRIIESARSRLGLPAEQVAINIDRYGNTSAASIAMAFDEARRDGTVGKGDVVLLAAFGAGVTWASCLLRL